MTERQIIAAIRAAFAQGYTRDQLAVDYAAEYLSNGQTPSDETVAQVQRVYDARFKVAGPI